MTTLDASASSFDGYIIIQDSERLRQQMVRGSKSLLIASSNIYNITLNLSISSIIKIDYYKHAFNRFRGLLL